jgi:cation:H+ antiporter
MILTVILLLAGLALLVKGADIFVAGGSGFAAARGISPAIIGLTIMAYGTSLPELVVSFNAAATGNTEIALGNVLGSNIVNIAFILALCTLLRPQMVESTGASRPALIRHTLIMLTATAIFTLLALRGRLDFAAGIVLLGAFVLILIALWRERTADNGGGIEVHGRKDIAYILIGLAAVIVGSQLLLSSSIAIATAFGVSAFVIGMSIVAVGTSLPELATSLIAAVRNEGSISIGNILGSNIFNLLAILGISAIFFPIPIVSIADVLAVALVSIALVPLLTGSRTVTRIWSAVLIITYFWYIIRLYGAAPL